MNNLEISKILIRCELTRSSFLGTFSADLIPAGPMPGGRVPPYGMVVNTDSSNEPGTHWVAMFVQTPATVDYFDSLLLSRVVRCCFVVRCCCSCCSPCRSCEIGSSGMMCRNLAAAVGFYHSEVTTRLVGLAGQSKRWLVSCGEPPQSEHLSTTSFEILAM